MAAGMGLQGEIAMWQMPAVPGAQTASDAAPSFVSIATAHKGDATWVKACLMAPHPPMEGINLSRQQIEDVTAYLQSLPSN